VLTYNVAGLPQGISSSNPVVNTVQISPLLNAWDLVLVQEDFYYHDDLISAVTHPYQSVKDLSIRPGTGFPGLTLGDGLNRFSRHPFSDHMRHTWEECFGVFTNASDCLAPKGFSVARHEVEPGVFLDVYNWHAEAGSAPEDDAARAANVRQMRDFIDVWSAGQAVLVLGDTNSRYADATDILPELLADVQLNDVWIELERGGVMPGLGPRLEDCAPPESGDCERIDKILFRSSNRLELVPIDYQVEDELFIDPDGLPLSDHLAVSAVFQLLVPEPSALMLGGCVLALALMLRRPRAA
jgi:hypothetical protein